MGFAREGCWARMRKKRKNKNSKSYRLKILILILFYLVSLIIVPRIWQIILLTFIAYIIIFATSRGSYNKEILVSLYLYVLPVAVLYDILLKLGKDMIFWPLSLQLSMVVYGLGNFLTLLIYWVSGLPLLMHSASIKGIVPYTISTIAPPLLLYGTLTGKGLKYIRATILAVSNYVNYKRNLFEEIINGVKESITWNTLLIQSKNEVKALLEPGIHYGPFKGIGSSGFPRYIINLSNYRVIPLHGCGSHERNLVSLVDAKKYAEDILKYLEPFGKECSPLVPVQGSNGNWNYLVLGCKEKPLIFLWNSKGSEDIPCEYVEKFLDKAILIDSHSIETSKMDLTGVDEVVEKALSSLRKCESTVLCCLEHFRVSDNIVEEANLCDNWIGVFKQCCGNTCKTVVIVPSNNIERESSLRYMEALQGSAHIVTIDDHSCLAEGSERGALLWSEKLSEEIKNAIAGCKPKSCKLGYKMGSAKLRIWGIDTFNELKTLMVRGKKAWYLILSLYILPILVLLIYFLRSI